MSERKLITITLFCYVPADLSGEPLDQEAEALRTAIHKKSKQQFEVIGHKIKPIEDNQQMQALVKYHEIVKKMKTHDWYYSYSDYSSVYRHGEKTEKELEALVSQLPQESIDLLWKKFAPSGFDPPKSKLQ